MGLMSHEKLQIEEFLSDNGVAYDDTDLLQRMFSKENRPGVFSHQELLSTLQAKNDKHLKGTSVEANENSQIIEER